MKNYLVKTLFEVESPDWQVLDRSREKDLYQKYQAMHDISLESYEKNLGGQWELKFLGGKVSSIHHGLEKTFWYIYDLWHSEPCNILYTDPDTMVLRHLDPWADITGFRMFNFTDPRQYQDSNRYQKKFPWFFNAGVRYFSHDMDDDTWNLGASMARDWDYTDYDTEQIILNSMLWSQGLTLHQCLQPELAYQAQWLPGRPLWTQNLWNGLDINKAAILHFHSSRNAAQKLQLMLALSSQANQTPK
jgi:hypothetical protein